MVNGINIIYVGRLDDNKGIMTLVRELFKFKDNIYKFTIAGDGPLRQELIELIESSDFIDYLGIVPHGDIHSLIRKHDLLVLPSHYDGWGAVVNEALYTGTRVLCSESCGAATLVDGKVRGGTFSWNEAGSLERALSYWCSKGTVTSKEREDISEWASIHISAQAAEKYLLSIVNYIQKNERQRPTAPWKE